MTVQKDVTKNIYVGNGSTRTFPFTFECPAEHPEYIKVYLMQDDGTALATSDYQLDMDARQITYPSSGTALPEGKKLVIMRELPLQQMMNLLNNGPYFAEDVETAFDENVMAMQQIAEKLNRSIIMSVDIDGDAFVNEVPFEAGKSFRIADDGKSIVLTEDPGKVIDEAKGLAEETATNAQEAKQAAAEIKTIYNSGGLTPITDLAGSIGTAIKRWGYIFANKVFAMNLPIVYKSVAEMKADSLLFAGMTACTLGYYAINDGGGGTYIIRAKQESDVDDGGSVHELASGLVAELVVENGTVCPEQFGAKGDGVSDDTVSLQNSTRFSKVVLSKHYLIKSLTINNNITFCGNENNQILSRQKVIFQCNDHNIKFFAINISVEPEENTSVPVMHFESCDNIEIIACNIVIKNYKGIMFDNCNYVRFKNNKVICKANAVEYRETNGEIASNIFDYEQGDSFDYHCIDVRINKNSPNYFVLIHDNNIRSYGNCIQLSSTSGANVCFVDIYHNTLYSKAENAVKFDGVTNGTFHHNTIDACVFAVGTLGRNGVTRNITISDNRILKCDRFIRDIYCKYSYNGAEDNYHWTEGTIWVENNYIKGANNIIGLGGTMDDIRTNYLDVVFKNNIIEFSGQFFYNLNNTSIVHNSKITIENNHINGNSLGIFPNVFWENTSISIIKNNIKLQHTLIVLGCDGEAVFSDNIIDSKLLASIRVIGKKVTSYKHNTLYTTRKEEGFLIYSSNDNNTTPRYVYDLSNVQIYNETLIPIAARPKSVPEGTTVYEEHPTIRTSLP